MKFICAALCIVMLASLFAACSNTYTVTFDYNYNGAPANDVVNVEKNTHVTEPDDPTRTNWKFIGWYTDSECTADADFGRIISSDITFYAGWKQTNVVITFDLNYNGSINVTDTIIIGDTVSRPASPKRNGYNFVGWYTDTNGKNVYDFTTKINSDMTLYAGWTTASEDDLQITYMWNYDGAPDSGIYDTQSVQQNGKIEIPPIAARKSRIFEGWYTDAAGQNKFDFQTSITADITLYARWTVVNTFEAECTDMTGFNGTGWSWSPTGTSGIDEDQYNSGAGNDAYVGNMYAKDTYIYFEIESDKDISGLTLKLRLSMEIFDNALELWPEIYSVTHYRDEDDYEVFDYDKITIERKIGYGVEKFENYLITTELNLKKGYNYFYLRTEKSFHDLGSDHAGALGSMAAFAPLVDALIIEHAEGAVELSWMERVCNLWNTKGKDGFPCSCDWH